jgi:hypothetical protein
MLYIFTFILVAFVVSLRFRNVPYENNRKEIQKKLAQATEFQRIGKLREYAELIQEVEELEKRQNGQ